MSTPRIERATPEDAADILALQHQAYQSEAALYDDATISPLTETIEEVRAAFADHVVLKATSDGTMIGSVRAHCRPGTCYIGRLMVHPDFESRGIGTQLMQAIEEACSAATRFELFTGHRSDRNLYLYRKLGYREFKREYVHDTLTLVYMEKDVGDCLVHG